MILRAANASLYLAATLLVWAAAGYVLFTRESPWQQGLALGAALISLLWGGYYVRLRYTLNAEGITRRGLIRSTCIRWEHATLSLAEQNTQETRSLTLTVSDGTGTITLSSDELPLEQVEELVADLRTKGRLPAAVTKS